MIEKELLSISDVGRFTGWSKPTIYSHLHKGLKSYTPQGNGGNRYVLKEELVAYIKGYPSIPENSVVAGMMEALKIKRERR